MAEKISFFGNYGRNMDSFDDYQHMLKNLADSINDNPALMINLISNREQLYSVIMTTFSMYSGGKLTAEECNDIIPFKAEDITIKKYICKKGILIKNKVYNVLTAAFPSVVPEERKDEPLFSYREVGSIVCFYDDSYQNVHVGITSFGHDLFNGNYFTVHVFEDHNPIDVFSWLQDQNAVRFKDVPDNELYELYAVACMVCNETNPHAFAFTAV